MNEGEGADTFLQVQHGKTPTPDDGGCEPPWWKNAVIYQLYVRSFSDANGDGAGDLAGVIERLRYLKNLGVDGIWFNPFYPSPQNDHGYDVSDYMNVEPSYGSLEVFRSMMAEARGLGLRIIMDIVPNHCSIEHPWFQEAIASAAGSKARERFYFADGRGEGGENPPNDWRSVFGGSAWTRTFDGDGTPGQWYLHSFIPEQPDLRGDHPEVASHINDVFRFWFDEGVDGFRFDAVGYVGKEPGLPDATEAPEGTAPENAWQYNRHTINHPKIFPIIKNWRETFDNYERQSGRTLVSIAEAYTPRAPHNLLQYVGAERFHQAFTFDLVLEPWDAECFANVIKLNHQELSKRTTPPAWTLNNHDAQRTTTRYGRQDATTFYSSNTMVNSTAPVDAELGVRRSRAAAMLMLSLPGSAYIYMGEELGLEEVLDIPDGRRQDPLFFRSGGVSAGRDGCRIPFPWNEDPSTGYGFTKTGVEPWLPQPSWWGKYAASRQESDEESTLSLYKKILRLRPVLISQGDEIDIERRGDILLIRRGAALVATNFSKNPSYLNLGSNHELLLSSTTGGILQDGSLQGDTCAWFLLKE